VRGGVHPPFAGFDEGRTGAGGAFGLGWGRALRTKSYSGGDDRNVVSRCLLIDLRCC
jgi:hypothetical protein